MSHSHCGFNFPYKISSVICVISTSKPYSILQLRSGDNWVIYPEVGVTMTSTLSNKRMWFAPRGNAATQIWRVNEHKQPDAPTTTPHRYDGHQLSVVWIKSTRMCAFLHFTDHKPGHWSGACIFTWSVLEANTWNSIWNTNYLQSVYYLLWLFGNRNGDFYLK